MAKKIYTLPWTMLELKIFCEGIVSAFKGGFLAWLNRMRTKPFVLVPDEEQKVKRFFLTEEDAAKWYEARAGNSMTPEIDALNFTKETVPGEEQYKMTFNVKNIDDSDTYGKTAKLRFDFSTADTLNGNRPTEEPIEIFFMFSSDVGVKTDTKRFNYSEGVTEFDITEYLEPDTNNITMLVRGLTSGLTLTAKATWTAVYLPFDSTFDIVEDRKEGINFGIPYSVSGVGAKEVEFVMDFGTPFNDTVYDGTATRTYNFRNTLKPGEHVLQMKAYTTVGNKRFESDMLYFEFIVNGEGLNLTTTIIKSRFPSGTPYFMDRHPGLIGEQFVDYLLQWAYFSTIKPNAIVQWKTKLNGVETIVGSRQIDEMEGTVGIMPDPVKFQPDTVGTYDLYAYIKGDEQNHIGEYTINVSENSAGLREASDYTMKLTARGRSNNEPDDTIRDWSNNGFKAIFNDKMTFDGLAGYTGDAVRFDNGATATITCKPFAVENSIITNGGAISLHFRTFNVEDEDALLFRIGDPAAAATAFLGIYGKKVVLRPSNGKSLEYEIASEEDTHLAIVVHPKTGVTDAQMMFFIFNGVEAPASPYGDTAVFNIGSYADKDNTNGMIEIGNAEGKAAIDVYGIRVYNSMLSMWQGMNNYMIDKGGDIARMMRKNNLFINNDFNRPNINKIKEQYRVLEVIGNLGLLEKSNKKENFYCSVIYTDPFNHRFNFERKDGGAYIETAGQSRLEDLMAKSFHLKLNENDTVATYQDGKLCYKNRFIFADGNIPENGVRIDLCGADSSITRNASHMKMVNKYYPYIIVDGEYVLRTPPQRYALSGKWSEDMASAWGGGKLTAKDFHWQHNINFAPDSVPIVVVWHEKADDPILVYGLACMTEEKKASYANGNHSIYIKEPLSDGTLDPFDRYAGTKGERGWDNEGVEEIEYVNPSDLTNNVSLEGFDTAATRDYSFELCFPKKKDLDDGGTAVWNIFKNEYLAPITATYGNQSAFDSAIENVIYLPSFAMYYNKVMDKKCNDSLCRNMHVLRYNMGTAENPRWLWWAKWWDVDVCCGLFQSNAMGVDPHADRQSKDANGNYVMAGHDMWLWNALEKNSRFNEWCKKLAVASYAAGWSAATEKAEQDYISDTFSEALYNLDGLLKFLYAYRNGNDYMIRMQGSSVPYRHGFIDASYAFREAQMAIGSYATRSVSFTATGAKHPCAVRMEAKSKWLFGIGTTSVNILTGIEHDAEDGEFTLALPEGIELGRDFLSVYGADKARTLDISDFTPYFSRQINLGNLTQVQELYIGYRKDTDLLDKGVNNDSSVSFTGIEAMSRLNKLSLRGLYALQEFDISSLSHLNFFIAEATSLKNFRPADGAKFRGIILPGTIQTIECRNVSIGSIVFIDTKVTPDGNWIPSDIDLEFSTPTSLLSLFLVGMGEDEGTHSLVHLWCQMLRENPHLINTAQITYRAIHWQGISKEDLFILAQIPKAQRNLTGYVYCDAVYTTEERQALTNAFGKNVFDPDAISLTLVCDANGEGVSITGTGETVVMVDGNAVMEQGNIMQLTAAGFPVLGSNAKNYRWRVWLNGQWVRGSDARPELAFGSMTLNAITGVLVTQEVSNEPIIVRIQCYDIETTKSGEIRITVNPRSYPEKVDVVLDDSISPVTEINGIINIITCPNSLLFKAKHTPDKFTGTLVENGGQWELVGSNEYIRTDQSALDFTLDVLEQPKDDMPLTLRYTSVWRNGVTRLTAEEVKMVIVTVIEKLLINDATDGNIPLFKAIENAGISHKAPYYNSMELKSLIGMFDVSALLGDEKDTLVNFRSGEYNVLTYLKNVTGINISGCTNIDDMDVSKMNELVIFNVSDTSKSLEIFADNNNAMTITDGGGAASVFVSDNKAEETRAKSDATAIEYASDFGETFLEWPDGTRVRYGNERLVCINNNN